DSLRRLGALRLEKGLQGAMETLADAAALSPDDDSLQVLLARAELAKGQNASARPRLERLAARRPEDPEILLRLAMLLFDARVRITSRLFGEARTRSGAAVADVRARPEHARWRAYALGSYGAIIAATLAAQLYSSNALDAYVKVQPVDLPALTQIFVRNDSHG